MIVSNPLIHSNDRLIAFINSSWQNFSMFIKFILATVLTIFSLQLVADATDAKQSVSASPWGLNEEERQRYTVYLATGSFTGLLTYGLLAWDWGSVND